MHEELLTYCRHFDISLAVISSPMPEVKLYEHLIEVVNSLAEFEMAVEECLAAAESNSTARLRPISGETWPQKVERISEALY